MQPVFAVALKPQPLHDQASIAWFTGGPQSPQGVLRSVELRYAGATDPRLTPSVVATTSVNGAREYDNKPNSALVKVNASGEAIRDAAKGIQLLLESAGQQGLMPRERQLSYGPIEPGMMRAMLTYDAARPGPAVVNIKIADAPEPLRQAFEAAQKLHNELVQQAINPKEAA